MKTMCFGAGASAPNVTADDPRTLLRQMSRTVTLPVTSRKTLTNG